MLTLLPVMVRTRRVGGHYVRNASRRGKYRQVGRAVEHIVFLLEQIRKSLVTLYFNRTNSSPNRFTKTCQRTACAWNTGESVDARNELDHTDNLAFTIVQIDRSLSIKWIRCTVTEVYTKYSDLVMQAGPTYSRLSKHTPACIIR